MNSFTIDGVDNNRLDITGHSQNVIQDSVAEFNLLTNQFSAEYGHSAGGQFNIITKTGTNQWHGDAWEYNQNRDYDARDNLNKADGLKEPPRFDSNRAGGDLGGPIIHDRLSSTVHISIFGRATRRRAWGRPRRPQQAWRRWNLSQTQPCKQYLSSFQRHRQTTRVLCRLPFPAQPARPGATLRLAISPL